MIDKNLKKKHDTSLLQIYKSCIMLPKRNLLNNLEFQNLQKLISLKNLV